MSILIDQNTQVLIQGITGREGSFHARQCLAYGTNIVAGVTPGKEGKDVEGVPVYDTVERALSHHRIDASMIMVPAPYAADSILEAVDAGISLIVCITEGIPLLDMVDVVRFLEGKKSRLIGPNCPGVITPGACKIGIMPGRIHRPGRVGVISRSGTLTYEAVHQISDAGEGQSSCIGIGGDPIVGTSFVDLLALFQEDPGTEGVVLIGEIGGRAEEDAAEFIGTSFTKPVVAYISGKTAPPGKRMGHAGAIISGGKGTAEAKIEALRGAGVRMAEHPAVIGETIRKALEEDG
ncbi:MAG: succinate--CoA ligase subunit alpha [Deltaproteobacteria bacterium]|nr:succinate--CoA ligase subunit alpha [Deltaproteobacteria bacterium]